MRWSDALNKFLTLPTQRELLQRQLEGAKRELTTTAMESERYQFSERMLRARIDRIEKELKQ